ncbi:hypothetical protein [Fructobacillus pseudoficulneus]|nr:hypothetical protein [Fructobacillus pseudoficulneus]
MTYNSIKFRFTRVAPDKTILYGEQPYDFSIDEKLTLSDEESAQQKLVVR